VADRALTGILLVGGASRRFGAPKALARLDGETLAERAWRLLGEVAEERLAVGKAGDHLALPFPLLDDGYDLRAALVGAVAGLRAAAHHVSLVVPVDMPRLTPAALLALADACAPAAAPAAAPLPAAVHKSVLPVLERRLALADLALHDALDELGAVRVEIDPVLLANVNTPADLREVAKPS
jgi:molybdenum cofactor guanylyltransferase